MSDVVYVVQETLGETFDSEFCVVRKIGALEPANPQRNLAYALARAQFIHRVSTESRGCPISGAVRVILHKRGEPENARTVWERRWEIVTEELEP